MKHASYLILLLALLLIGPIAGTSASNGELTIFEVQSRPAQDLVSPLRQALGDQGSVAAAGSRLIIRAPSERLEEMRWLIGELDKPARALMIEVRVDRHDYANEQRFQVGGKAPHEGAVGSFYHRERGTDHNKSTQKIRTLDGRAAFIRSGQAVPVYEVSNSKSPDGEEHQSYRVRYRDVTQGFYVLPRLHGNKVTLELYQQDERQASRVSGHFNIQNASSVIQATLGEWVGLGSINTRAKDKHSGIGGSGIGHSASTRSRDQRHISVRVTLLKEALMNSGTNRLR